MSKLDRETFMSRIQGIVGDATDDDTLAFIADMTDTYDGLSAPSDFEEKYNALLADNEKLRKEYKDRFFAGSKPDTPPDKGASELTYDDLFK